VYKSLFLDTLEMGYSVLHQSIYIDTAEIGYTPLFISLNT